MTNPSILKTLYCPHKLAPDFGAARDLTPLDLEPLEDSGFVLG